MAVDFTGFYHETKGRYAYAVDLETLHVRLRCGKGAVDSVRLLYFDPFDWAEGKDKIYHLADVREVSMKLEQSTRHHDWWFAEISAPKRVKYGFIVEDYLYGTDGEYLFTSASKQSHIFYNFPYILAEDIFKAPEWVAQTVWYQIFPERFASGNIAKIPGITERLDYINDLGFTGIYLTPIQKSPSYHKYNTEDYYEIDPSFGTKDDFRELVEEAHKRGIKIMLDLVFNHIGDTNPIWGQVEKSDWFHIKSDGTYETFAMEKHMPKWNTGNPDARKYLMDVALYWAEFGVDGFRLDVANEVSHDFWREFRRLIKSRYPDMFILGELWDDGMPWLLGDQFDSVMNYSLAAAIWKFVSGETNWQGLREDIAKYLTMYPKDRQKFLFNLLGTHDTDRILTICKGDKRKLKQALLILLSFAGSPMIFYGDEIGIEGEGHDGTRKPMIFESTKIDGELRSFVKKLIAMRKEYDDMRSVDVEWINDTSYKKGQLIINLESLEVDVHLC